MKKLGNLVAAVGEYEKNGETKTQWKRCGALFQRDDGSYSVKQDAVPVSENWNGWFNVFSDEPKQETVTKRDDLDDSIPF